MYDTQKEVNYKFKWVPFHHSMAILQVIAEGGSHQIWKVAANMNKELWTANSSLSSSFRIGWGLKTSNCKNLSCFLGLVVGLFLWRLIGHVGDEKRRQNFGQKPKAKILLGRLRHRWEDNIKMDFKAIRSG
jgi:hypothetical protein